VDDCVNEDELVMWGKTKGEEVAKRKKLLDEKNNFLPLDDVNGLGQDKLKKNKVLAENEEEKCMAKKKRWRTVPQKKKEGQSLLW